MAAAGAYLSFPGIGNYDQMTKNHSSEHKIHVFTKAFTWMNYDEMASLIADAGCEGIDMPVRKGGMVLPEYVERDLPKACEAADKKGLSVEMMVTEITGTDKTAERVLKTASSLGIKYYRFGYLNYDNNLGVQGTLDKFQVEFKKLEELNEKFNIHGAYQNHSGIRVGGPVWDIYELLKGTDPQYIGCQYDIRHAVVEGFTSWINGFKVIAPWIRCNAIKDFTWSMENGKWAVKNVPLGEGVVNFDEFFSLLKEYNIPGPFSLHLEYPPFEGSGDKIPADEKRKLFYNAITKDVNTLKSFRAKYKL